MKLLVACAAVLAVAAGSAGASSTVYTTFKTPSGNIGCAFSKQPGEGAGLRCEIVSGLKPAGKKPKRCGTATWGRSVVMSPTGRANRICITDTIMDPDAKVLAYGSSWRKAGFVCTSKSAGLTCRNGSGHGWFLSRASSRVF